VNVRFLEAARNDLREAIRLTPFCRFSHPFPLVPVDAGLAEDSGQELHANISLMWVRDSDDDVAPDHELMFATGIGAFESELLEIPNQVFSFDGSERGHQATSWMVISIPSMAGNGRCL